MNRLVAGKLALAALLICAAAATTHAQTAFTNLANFDGTNGAHPTGPLIQGLNGNLYGTTAEGGANSYGTVFEMTAGGAVKVLHNFCSSPNCADGAGGAILLLGTDGNIYGTANQGGNIESCPYDNTGCGTIFKMTPQGKLTTLYSFCSQTNCADGAVAASLIQAANGDFYGATFLGGLHQNGTIFRITSEGKLTTLYSFCPSPACTDGSTPTGLVQATNGDFYGTTQGGGTNNQGSVFKITPAGSLTTLYSFCSLSNCSDGAGPEGGLIQGANGNFYGTTWQGGIASTGVAFEITPTGELNTLYEFCSKIVGGICTDGEKPYYGPLIQATDGNFYGTTLDGGVNGNAYGTAFEFTPTGSLTTVYSFCSQTNCADGYVPERLVQSTNGLIYGTTQWGGSIGYGSVFTLNAGLGPFVETLPARGSVGSIITILGTNLTGATAVSFNGTPATFTVVSRTAITTTVPAGATSGKVLVKTPAGGLSSNVIFRVKP